MHSIVTHVDATGLSVRAQDGTQSRYEAGTVLWTAGVAAPAVATVIAKATGAQQDRSGRILVGADLSISGHPEILVTGDVMSLNKLPGVAEVACSRACTPGTGSGTSWRAAPPSRSGITTWARPRTSPRPRGRIDGRMHFGGFPGWVVWLFIHIAFLTGYRSRLGAVLSWWLAFTRDMRRERTFTISEVGRVRDVYTASIEPSPDPVNRA
jgi:NADH dehydrogenase